MKKSNSLIIFFAFICALILFPKFFEANIYPINEDKNELWKSLDPSWLIALNYASIKNLEWGNEIIFTYGPLSFLATKVGWGHSKYSFLIYDLFLFINYFFLFFFTLKRSSSKVLPILFIILTLFLIPSWLGSSNAFILLAILVFWIRLSIDEPKIIYYCFQIVILSLIFFIKFNTGLIAFPLFYIGIFYNGYSYKNFKKYLFLSILPILLILLLCKPLNVDLIKYIKSGRELISGYNDVMYLEHEIKNRILSLIIVSIIVVTYIFKFFKEKNKIKNIVLFILIGIPIFVLYKQGFVRGIELDFFILTPFIVLASQDIINQNDRKSVILSIILLLIPIIHVFNIDKNRFDITDKLTFSHYVHEFQNFSKTSGLHIYPNNNLLPKKTLEIIGNETIDSYPWNLHLLFENKLNYSSRPVLQSYTTYTTYLEEQNFNFYNDFKTAPEFVIYDFATIDYRYAYFDEMKLQIVFEKNYEAIDFFDYKDRKLILLKKKKNFRPIKFIEEKEYAIYINKPFVPEKGKYYEFEVYNTLLGKGYSIFKNAPEIEIKIFGNQNYPYIYRTSKELLKIGLYSNNYISNNFGMNNFLKNDYSSDIEKIKYYTFEPKKLSLFKEKIKVTEYKITQ